MVGFLDAYVVNVAVPAIGRDLHASVASVQWILTGYLLTVAGLLLLAGALADRFGRRRILVVGLRVMLVASICCALAPSSALLIAARVVQGVGAAHSSCPAASPCSTARCASPTAPAASASGPGWRRSGRRSARTSAGGSSTTRRGGGCSCSTSR